MPRGWGPPSRLAVEERQTAMARVEA